MALGQTYGHVRQEEFQDEGVLFEIVGNLAVVNHSPLLHHHGAAGSHLLEEPDAEICRRGAHSTQITLALGVIIVRSIVDRAAGEELGFRRRIHGEPCRAFWRKSIQVSVPE